MIALFAGTPLKPIIPMINPIILNTNNYNLSMKCISDLNELQYTWERKNDQLSSRTRGAHTSNLIILNLQPEDAGEYQCIMSNSTGRIASDYTTLTVIGLLCVMHMYIHT